jgi:hypothetical protein
MLGGHALGIAHEFKVRYFLVFKPVDPSGVFGLFLAFQ